MKRPHLLPSDRTGGGSLARSTITTASTADPLMLLPAELLVKIISHLQPSFYWLFFLNQTSRALRQFIKTHACAICNASIRENHADKLELLGMELVNGWLVPTHPDLLFQEVRNEKLFRAEHYLPKSWTFPIRLSNPGPAFLFMLPVICRREKGKDGKEVKTVSLNYRVHCSVNGLEWTTGRNVPADPRPRRWALTWFYGYPEDRCAKARRG